MNVAELKNRKLELGYSNEEISQLTGVPLGTVQKIFAGITQRPRHDTLVALESLLAVPFRFEREPEQREVETLKQVLEPRYQFLKDEIYDVLKLYARQNRKDCSVSNSVFNVHLSTDDDENVLQPDILVVCDRSKISQRGIEGAPDLVIDIASPLTKRKDGGLKLMSYMDAGVREYWVVDTEKEKVVIYTLVDDYPVTKFHTFDDVIPVGIFDGECQIDMKAVCEEVAYLNEAEEDVAEVSGE